MSISEQHTIYSSLNGIFCSNPHHRKKILALVLAFACAFTMFAGAAFTDQADINADNAEAVDLLTTLNIIGGYPDGTFDPEGTVDRAEMAKMIYTIRNGGNDDASAHVDNTTSFTDINGHWAEGYIKYLQNTGIVAGKSATTFDPDSPVTTTEAMKMALALAGYDEKNAELTGVNWSKNTLTLATTYGLTDNVSSAMTAGCTRQDAAQILANCLNMTAVRYSTIVEDFVNDSKNGLSWGGDPISVGYKWMDLYTNVGTLIRIDGEELEIRMNTSDEKDSDSLDEQFQRVGTDYSALLGQKVKVLFNDGKTNDVIGVYAVPDNNVIVVNQNEIDVDAGKIVIGDNSYSVETDGILVILDGDEQDARWKAGAFKNEQSANVVTLIDTDDNNKIDTAYIKTVDVQKVTYVSSSQIIAGSKTYKFADDNIADGVAKDDWVIITKNLYNDNNDLEIASMATGTVNATKAKTDAQGNAWKQFQIGDTWYNEAAANSGKDINSNVKPGVDAEYIAVNGIVFYAAKTSAGADKLTDVLFVAFVGKDGLSNDQARVMFPNGDKATINLKNSYSTKQDGTKGAAIVDGQFYEYSKSGNTYELIDLSYDDDFYGDFTYEGKGDLKNNAEQVDSDKIADSADVIVWTTNGTDKVDFKHITGKQLKALVKGGMKFDGTANSLVKETLGYFTSDVDGLNRASVLAVKYNGDGKLGTAFDNISSNANYGFITKSAVKAPNGMIMFTVWTGTNNVEVYAEKSSERDFTKGTIVGYTDIVEEDGRNVMTDANAIATGVTAGSITAVNTAGTKIESTISNAPEDLDDYSTVLYVDSKAGTGIVDGTAAKANSQKVNNRTYYATNLLVYGTEVVVIDVNEIAGSTYNAFDLPGTISGLTDVQWLNTRTNDTDEGAAYKGAIMQLSFYADAAGKLTLTNVVDIESGTVGTVVLNYKEGYNKFDSLIVIGNVSASSSSSGSTSTSGNVSVVADENMKNIKSSINASGDVTVAFDNPGWVANNPKLATKTISIDGIMVTPTSSNVVLSSDKSQINVTFAGVKATSTQEIEVKLGGLTADYVYIKFVDGAGYSIDTNSISGGGVASALSAQAESFKLVVPAGIDTLNSVTYSVTGLKNEADNKDYTKADPITTGGAAQAILVADKNIQAAGNDYVTVTIKSVGTKTENNAVTYTGAAASKIDTTASTKTVVGASETLTIKTVADAKAAKYKMTYAINNGETKQVYGAAAAGVGTFTITSVNGTADVEVNVMAIDITEYVVSAIVDNSPDAKFASVVYTTGGNLANGKLAVAGEEAKVTVTPASSAGTNKAITLKVKLTNATVDGKTEITVTGTTDSTAATNPVEISLGTVIPTGAGPVGVEILATSSIAS